MKNSGLESGMFIDSDEDVENHQHKDDDEDVENDQHKDDDEDVENDQHKDDGEDVENDQHKDENDGNDSDYSNYSNENHSKRKPSSYSMAWPQSYRQSIDLYGSSQLSRESSIRRDPPKVSHEVYIPGQCTFRQAVLNGGKYTDIMARTTPKDVHFMRKLLEKHQAKQQAGKAGVSGSGMTH